MFAFRDDTHISLCVLSVYGRCMTLQRAQFGSTHVSACTRAKPVSGTLPGEPAGIATRGSDPDAPAWVGDWSLPPQHTSVPRAHSPRFPARALQLQRKREEHDRLLQRLPDLEDLQGAWLLLHSCASLAEAHDEREHGDAPIPATSIRKARLLLYPSNSEDLGCGPPWPTATPHTGPRPQLTACSARYKAAARHRLGPTHSVAGNGGGVEV